jgi:hypothetical protein
MYCIHEGVGLLGAAWQTSESHLGCQVVTSLGRKEKGSPVSTIGSSFLLDALTQHRNIHWC